ncbi:MAG: cysteine--tRNA ligase [Candidatus Nealsonbacteria bacterium]|nr:cysteine--tRNA ligase [Candidatus Nealsonbacteria bacterium]
MLKLYNTLSQKKEIFKPRQKNKVNLFVCGPTVYDFSHLGHARNNLVFDMIVNFLRKTGFDVFYLQNITDIDDKIIKRAKEKNISPKILALQFEKEHLKDMESLKIDSVSKYAKATEHIPEIISQVKRLIEKGFAYQIEDGVYYNISKFKEYGKLSKRTALQAQDGVSRIDEGKNKKNKGDFCLWKLSKPDEPKWESPWGEGRPGWHIEDTAITEKYFGFQYDIHGGGRDLIFPHHEAEIAQMEAISGKKPIAKYWLHAGFLTIENKKMSKSLGNFIIIRNFLKENSAELLRLFVFLSHYRSPIDYNLKKIKQVKNTLERINDFYKKIGEKINHPAPKGQKSALVKKFLKILEDDFNTPKFFSLLFDLIRKSNKKFNKLSGKEIKEIYELLLFTDEIFKIFKKEGEIPAKILEMASFREKYRQQKNWEMADKTRKEIEALGFSIEDAKDGQKIKKNIS